MTELVNPAPEENEVEVLSGGYMNTLSFDELDTAGGLEVISHDLVDEDEQKNWLRGMYFIVTGVTFRTGDYRRDFISCETVVASEDKFNECLKRSQLAELHERFPNMEQTAEMLPGWLYPQARIVFNDGSSGIRSQVVAMLHHTKVIQVPGGDFTSNANEWKVLAGECVEIREKDEDEYSFRVHSLPGGRPFAIKCHRGLRVSGYKWDEKLQRAVDGEGQRTYYLS